MSKRNLSFWRWQQKAAEDWPQRYIRGEIVFFISLHRFVLPVCFINPTHVPGILSVFPSSHSLACAAVFVAGAGAPPLGSQLRKVSCWEDETRPEFRPSSCWERIRGSLSLRHTYTDPNSKFPSGFSLSFFVSPLLFLTTFPLFTSSQRIYNFPKIYDCHCKKYIKLGKNNTKNDMKHKLRSSKSFNSVLWDDFSKWGVLQLISEWASIKL